MTHSGDRSPNLNLLERLGAVFLAVLLTGVAFAFVGLVNVSIQAWALNLAIAAGLGLISGLAARLALRRYRWPLRMAAALATVVVGMIFVGWLTSGFAGIHASGQLAPRRGLERAGPRGVGHSRRPFDAEGLEITDGSRRRPSQARLGHGGPALTQRRSSNSLDPLAATEARILGGHRGRAHRLRTSTRLASPCQAHFAGLGLPFELLAAARAAPATFRNPSDRCGRTSLPLLS